MLRLCLALFLLIPTPVFAYHVPTQAPSNLTLTVDYENGTVKADWDASDQMEDYPAERYAIGFGLSDEVSLPYGIATGNVGDSNALNTEYTFTASYLNAVFNEAHGLFHAAIRSDNDTNASYSEWTPTVSITIQNKPASVTLASYDMNREDGIKFEWSASTSGFVSASTYKMYYKLSNASEWTLEGQQSNTDYVLAWDNLTDDTYDFMLSACGSENDCNDSNTLTVDVVTYVAPTTTTSTTTTTTLPPKVEEVYVEPEPLPPPPEEIIVDVKVEGVDKTYTQADVNDGTIERDQERIDNEKEFGCFMTNAQIERGDCDIPEPIEEDIKDDIIKEEVVVEEIKEDVEVIIPEDDVDVLDPPKEEVFKDEVVEFEEPLIEFEIIEFDLEDIASEIVVEIPVQDEIKEEIVDEKVEEDVQEVLDEPIQEIIEEDIDREILEAPIKEPLELTEEEVAVEVAEIDEVIVIELEIASEEEIEEFTEEELVEYEAAKEEAIQEYVQDLTEEEVVEVLEEVNDIGVQNLDQATEEIQEVVQAVVEEAIADVAELTEEQVEVVAEVLQVEAEDVAIIAESVKDDEVIAEAVEEYVARAVENTDVENYTLADVVTEISYESFIENPIETFVDFDDLGDITIANIGDDMTQDQKEKAQEVVVPVILTRIASMAAFIFRRS
ncbi:hypothetical protein OAY22_03085 [Acidimicrobiia bacterium]|nr:hypothetical protein [Acidimicrobiia bacterium]